MASTITLQRTVNLAQQFLRLAPLIFTAAVNLEIIAAGTAYTVGDIVSLGGGFQGRAMITAINGSGGATGLLLLSGGYGFINNSTSGVSGGTGSGLEITILTSNDPAFSNADWVMQTILSPSLGGWRWNRGDGGTYASPLFQTQIGVPDYTVNIPNFGWIEKATAYDPNAGYQAYELQVSLDLSAETTSNQPARISAQFDDDAGNITFRIFPAPDKVYNVAVEFQNSAQLFTSIQQTWAPIPDYLGYIVNEGFQAKAYEYSGDPRFTNSYQTFYTNLASCAEGLDQTQKNLWLSDRLNSIRQTMTVQQGRA
jgi:hypothetical protein